jgi:hypothetical protein
MTDDGRPSIIGGAATSPAGDASVSDRRRKIAGRAEEVRNRTLRREAEAREEKEAMRRSNAAKSASLRAQRLARAATAADGAAPSRRTEGD